MTVTPNGPAVRADDLVAAASRSVPEIGVVEAKALIDRGEVDLILDVREANEWDEGHLAGALLSPRGLLEWHADPTSPWANPELTKYRDARIIVHCKAGLRSLLACQTLAALGYSNVTSLAGGIDDWIAHGYPVE